MTKDNISPERLSEYESVVLDWAKNISKTAEVREIDLSLLRLVLERHGANFEISERAHKSLAHYSNLAKEEGVIAVWGKDRLDETIVWIRDHFIPESEKKYGKEFPDLHDPKTNIRDKRGTTNYSGSLQFFTSLTALASEDRSFEDIII